MSLLSDVRVLSALLRGQPEGSSHAERLHGFYAPQAARYDLFREGLLHGRKELLADLAQQLPETGAMLVDMGGGTGRNLAFLDERLQGFARIEVVDLCVPLLEQARKRWEGHSNIVFVEADAVCYQPAIRVDAVYFSYSLTMIPDWFSAIDNAIEMLKPGGWLAVVDFYVSRKYPAEGWVRHGGLTRHFWPAWFAHDGVRPNQDHLPYLESRLERVSLHESSAKVPYLLGLKVPYYRFIGRKAAKGSEPNGT